MLTRIDPRSVVRDLNTPRVMPKYRTLDEWLRRAAELRTHILMSCGLYPPPQKCPLNARIFDRQVRAAYTVEKVYFESYPGFLVTGNLYRPKGRRAKCPAVLSAHGHWPQGRVTDDTPTGSVQACAIVLAQQGYVVFSFDMVGFNDSTQVSHTFGDETKALWGISLHGLQLWNSVRAVDFLCSLPDVDSKRIGMTGASGGGTQTFMLMAVEPRIAAAVPVCMVSAHFQGGCLCENAPNLRVDTFNVEIAALMAPRPLLLVAATGDWTVNTHGVEYPAIRSIYRLFGATDRVAYVHFDAPHNYNKDSREAMYAWFGRWLLKEKNRRRLKEPEHVPADKMRELLVFYGRPHPRPDVNEHTLTQLLIRQARKQMEFLKPDDVKSFNHFRRVMEPALRHALSADIPSAKDVFIVHGKSQPVKGLLCRTVTIRRNTGSEMLDATSVEPSDGKSSRGIVATTLVIHPRGKRAIVDTGIGKFHPIVRELVRHGQRVVSLDCFGTGENVATRDKSVAYFTTYNRTDVALRVQDIITTLCALRACPEIGRVNLIGVGEAGLWCLLARGLVGFVAKTAADVMRFDGSDAAFLKHLNVPCLRRAGELATAITLAAPKPLFLHNTGRQFKAHRWAKDIYCCLKADDALRVQQERATAQATVSWVAEQ